MEIGLPISKVFAENTNLYPIFVAEMIAVGEETGELGGMLLKVSDFYEDEVNKKKKELHAMTILKDYIHFLEDENHLVSNQMITAKHDKKEILNEINKIKHELEKISKK